MTIGSSGTYRANLFICERSVVCGEYKTRCCRERRFSFRVLCWLLSVLLDVVVSYLRIFTYVRLSFITGSQLPESCSKNPGCKKPPGVKALLHSPHKFRIESYFCTGAFVTFYCKSNRVLEGPQEFLQNQSVECLRNGWSIDLSTVRCLDQQGPSGSDLPLTTGRSSATYYTVLGTAPTVRLPTSSDIVRTSSGVLTPTVQPGAQTLTYTDSDVNDQRMWDVESYDGWYNNLAHPDWGAAGTLFDKFRFKLHNCDLVLLLICTLQTRYSSNQEVSSCLL